MLDTRDELEFAICQYVDGTLAPSEVTALESRLSTDPEAADLLRQHRELTAALKSPIDLPAINWTALQHQISSHIAAAEADDAPAPLPMPWLSAGTRRLALAACVALASALAIYVLTPNRPTTPNTTIATNTNTQNTPATQLAATVLVAGPTPEFSVAPATTSIQIGPAPALAATPNRYHTEALLHRPTTIVIEASAVQDRPPASLFH